jgi:ABC-type proline/glycine betaine transport system permease subunit
MTFTRRERHVFIFTILALVFAIAFDPWREKYEILWLLFFVAPVGFYIATDTERRQ